MPAGTGYSTKRPSAAGTVERIGTPFCCRETLVLPSGRSTPLDYRDDGRIVASVKLQELFGLGETPRIGPRGIPVTFELLAPNARPVQVTTDLRSFWTSTYPELRGALRARYPRHPWPEDGRTGS